MFFFPEALDLGGGMGPSQSKILKIKRIYPKISQEGRLLTNGGFVAFPSASHAGATCGASPDAGRQCFVWEEQGQLARFQVDWKHFSLPKK